MILDLHDLFATDTPCGLDSGTKRLVLFDPSSAPRLRFTAGGETSPSLSRFAPGIPR